MAWYRPGDQYEVEEYWEEAKERKKGGQRGSKGQGSKDNSTQDIADGEAASGVMLVRKTRELVKRPAARQVLPGVPPRKQGMYKVSRLSLLQYADRCSWQLAPLITCEKGVAMP